MFSLITVIAVHLTFPPLLYSFPRKTTILKCLSHLNVYQGEVLLHGRCVLVRFGILVCNLSLSSLRKASDYGNTINIQLLFCFTNSNLMKVFRHTVPEFYMSHNARRYYLQLPVNSSNSFHLILLADPEPHPSQISTSMHTLAMGKPAQSWGLCKSLKNGESTRNCGIVRGPV